MRYYRFGGLRILLDAPPFTEMNYFSEFRTAPCEADLTYRVSFMDALTLPMEAPLRRLPLETVYPSARVLLNEHTGEPFALISQGPHGEHEVLIDRARSDWYGTRMFLKLLDLPQLAIRHGGIFLHASYIDFGGEAIVFTAPKGVGKSTQAALWNTHRGAPIVNGDRALLWKLDGHFCACGSPYCGTSKICHNVTLPLRAIVILGQAPENSVRRATAREAFAALLNGCSYEPTTPSASDAIGLIEQVISDVPFYRLDCVPDESAVQALEEVL